MEDSLIKKFIELDEVIDKDSDIYISVQEFEAFINSMHISINKKQLIVHESDFRLMYAKDLN